MISVKIVDGLYCGDAEYWEAHKDEFEYIIHACKEPYHRRALGYTGRGAPKDNPEYLIAYRGKDLILNLVDADNPLYIPPIIMSEAVRFIMLHNKNGEKVFVHCNEGKSRAPGIVLYYLMLEKTIYEFTYEDTVAEFKKVYPLFEPGKGIDGFLRERHAEEIFEISADM